MVVQTFSRRHHSSCYAIFPIYDSHLEVDGPLRYLALLGCSPESLGCTPTCAANAIKHAAACTPTEASESHNLDIPLDSLPP